MSGPNKTFNCGAYYVCQQPQCADQPVDPQKDDQAGDIALYGKYQPPPPPTCHGVLCAIHQSGTTKPQIVQWLESLPPDQIPLNV